MSMITGFWDDIKLVCGNHTVNSIEEYPEMIIVNGAHSPYYSCPHHNVESAIKQGVTPCFNRINLIDYNKMLDHLMKELVNAELRDEKPNLTHHKWKEKSRNYEVLLHKNDKLIVSMIDVVAIKGHKI